MKPIEERIADLETNWKILSSSIDYVGGKVDSVGDRLARAINETDKVLVELRSGHRANVGGLDAHNYRLVGLEERIDERIAEHNARLVCYRDDLMKLTKQTDKNDDAIADLDDKVSALAGAVLGSENFGLKQEVRDIQHALDSIRERIGTPECPVEFDPRDDLRPTVVGDYMVETKLDRGMWVTTVRKSSGHALEARFRHNPEEVHDNIIALVKLLQEK